MYYVVRGVEGTGTGPGTGTGQAVGKLRSTMFAMRWQVHNTCIVLRAARKIILYSPHATRRFRFLGLVHTLSHRLGDRVHGARRASTFQSVGAQSAPPPDPAPDPAAQRSERSIRACARLRTVDKNARRPGARIWYILIALRKITHPANCSSAYYCAPRAAAGSAPSATRGCPNGDVNRAVAPSPPRAHPLRRAG